MMPIPRIINPVVALCFAWSILPLSVSNAQEKPSSNQSLSSGQNNLQLLAPVLQAAPSANPRRLNHPLPFGETVSWNHQPEQEQALLRLLGRHDDVPWRGLTLADIAAILENDFPTYINRPELDLLGVDENMWIENPIPQGSVLGKLTLLLEPLRLTINYRNGLLEITSQDAADSIPMIRVYRLASSRERVDEVSIFNSLHHHVDPDNWLAHGGTNTMTFSVVGDEVKLVVSAPLTTQLKVSALLTKLIPATARESVTRQRSSVLPESSSGLPKPYLKLK